MRIPTAWDVGQVQSEAPRPAVLEERLPRGAGAAFGETIGHSISQAGQEITGELLREQEKRKNDLTHVQVMDAESQAHQSFVDEMKTFNSLHGQNAVDASSGVMERLNKNLQDIGSKIQIPHAQELFNARAKGLIAGYQSHIDGRVKDEITNSSTASLKTNIGTTLSAIATNPLDSELVTRSHIALENNVEAFGQINGLDKNQINEQKREVAGRVGRTVIEGILALPTSEKTLAAARGAYVTYSTGDFKGSLGEEGPVLLKKIKTIEEMFGADNKADDVAGKYKIGKSILINEDLALKDIDSDVNLSPEQKIRARAKLMSTANDFKRANDEKNNAVLSVGLNAIYSGKGIPKEVQTYLSDNRNLAGREKAHLYDALHKREMENRGMPPSDAERNVEINALAWTVDHPELAGKMTPQQFKELVINNKDINPDGIALSPKLYAATMQKLVAAHATYDRETSTFKGINFKLAYDTAKSITNLDFPSDWKDTNDEQKRAVRIINDRLDEIAIEKKLQNKPFIRDEAVKIIEKELINQKVKIPTWFEKTFYKNPTPTKEVPLLKGIVEEQKPAPNANTQAARQQALMILAKTGHLAPTEEQIEQVMNGR